MWVLRSVPGLEVQQGWATPQVHSCWAVPGAGGPGPAGERGDGRSNLCTHLISLHLPVSVSVRQVFTHPKWNPQTIDYDIALIKLATPAKLSRTVSPVCLGETRDHFYSGELCVTTGWGKTRYNGTCRQLDLCRGGDPMPARKGLLEQPQMLPTWLVKGSVVILAHAEGRKHD